MQTCRYLGNGQPQSKTEWNLGLRGVGWGGGGGGGSLGNICASSGTFANAQVSCPNMAILKWPVCRKLLPVEQK